MYPGAVANAEFLRKSKNYRRELLLGRAALLYMIKLSTIVNENYVSSFFS